MIHDLVVAQCSKMLTNLSAMLDMAEAYAGEKKFDVGVLLQSRLAPDQFDLIRQVQIACDTAKIGAAKLADKTPPGHPDTEKTVGELKARIASVIDYLGSLPAGDFAAAAQRRVTQPRWNGKTLSGQEFLMQHVLPNFYFHVTTAYDILRHNGVGLGKRHYLGNMPFRDPA